MSYASGPLMFDAHPRETARMFSTGRAVDLLGSVAVTVAIVVGFTLQAAWVAVTARLSIYDEAYHVAAIRAFSTRWTPFIHQTAADGPLGDAERYGSYLYPYLLSFPYRATQALGFGEGPTLMMLRLITVLAVAGALVYVWRLFRELGAGPVTANVALAVVALMPLSVFLAGSLNYDNLLALLATAFFYYGLRLYKADHIDVGLWLRVLLVGGLAGVTKFTFLALAPVLVVGILVRQVPLLRREMLPALRGYFRGHPSRVRALRALLAVGAALGCALVLERYGLNMIRYGTPTPSCFDVLPADVCVLHAPTARNIALESAFNGVAPSVSGALTYLTYEWIPLMLRYLTYTGVLGADGLTRTTLGPHIFGTLLTWSIPVVLALVLLATTTLRRVRGARLLLGAVVMYTLVLFGQNYLDYSQLGQPVGVQGRYVLVILPVIVGLACVALAQLVTRGRPSLRPRAALGAVIVLAFVLSQGGGVTTYLFSGDAAWWRASSGLRFTVASQASRFADELVIPDALVRDPRS